MTTVNQINENQTSINETQCIALTNKGIRCKCKSKINGLCKRHYNKGIENIYTIFNKPEKKSTKLKSNFQKRKKIYDSDDILKIKIIQSLTRGIIVRCNIKNRGIAVYCRHLLTNETDFAEFLDIKNNKEIENKNFISYKDSTNNYWGFNIATFKELIKYKSVNPYSTDEIPKNIIDSFNNFLEKIEKTRKISIEKDKITNPKLIIQQKCIKVFQLIDDLKHYTQCSWFTNLSLNQLKELYKQIEDIWNYRVGLTNQDKFKYVKNGKLFTCKIHEINSIKSKNVLSKILLEDFERLVTEGQTTEDCQTGALWVLSALTIVSYDARQAMPWLFQSANVY